MSSPSFYSQAGNFIDAVQGGVDPRTGLFSISLPVASIHPNNLAGPALELALRYSPLSSFDEGFGRGFALNLTRYDESTQSLVLSTGEEYSVSSSGNVVRQKKFRNFIFEKTDELHCRIIHKSGLIEVLRKYKSEYRPVSIKDASGRGFRLSWVTSYNPVRLYKVWDDDGMVLCKVDSSAEQVAIPMFTVLSGNTESSYNISFSYTASQLSSVTSSADTEPLVWTFDYNDVGPGRYFRVITGITSPTGLKEVVVYSSTGMAFPDIAPGLLMLPCVVQHSLISGCGQPPIVTQWEWTEENYLGKNLPHKQWQRDTDPMLHTLRHDYLYGSTAKMLDAATGSILGSVTRRYNNYHLQVSETTLRAGKTYSVTTEYHARSGIHFDEQPAQYLLPVAQSETWKDSSGSRTRVTRREFDEMGNQLRLEAPDGSVTECVYYPAGGDGDACPADPHGFIRHLKSKTVTPCKIKGDEPKAVSIHIWKKQSDLLGQSYAVVPASVEETIGSVKTIITREYYHDLDDVLAFGREKKRTTILIPDTDKPADVSYIRTEDFIYESREKGLFQSVTLTTHDSLKLTRSTLRHRALGHLLSETDAQGVMVTHTYDKTGRPQTRTMAAGTVYARTTTWSYTRGEAGLATTETDAAGNRIKIIFDSAGRETKRERFDNDYSQKWFEVSSRNYNALGEVVEGSGSDWLTGISGRYIISTTTRFDGWGNISEQATSDGIKTLQLNDPVALANTTYTLGYEDGKEIGTGTLTSVLEKRSLLPQREMWSDVNTQTLCIRLYQWDGLGRLRLATDELSRNTEWTYDVFGRVLTQTLQDGSVVTHTYAPHLSGDQLASISVSASSAGEKIIGTQDFDGLGRLTKRVSGGRTTTYVYAGASPVPETIILPSGRTLKYTYIPELGNAVSNISAGNVTQAFSYDVRTGNLLTVKEGGSEVRRTILPSGNIQNETFCLNSTSRTAGYIHSLAGVMLSYTDIAGKTTHYQRDKLGRLTTITDEILTISLGYDGLGRLSEQVVTDISTQAMLTTLIGYDDFGQESVRAIVDSKGMILRQLNKRLKNGLLAKRTTQQDSTVIRQEQYSYDARNRLTEYTVSGSSLPQDAYGNQISRQMYQYDVLNNLLTVTTSLADGSVDTATYHYKNAADPTQLTKVVHTHADYPQNIYLQYDADGRMVMDEAGHILAYDATGRLVSISGNGVSGSYGYDGLNRLVNQTVSDSDTRQLYYRADVLVNEIQAPQNKTIRLIKHGSACHGVSDDSTLTLTAGDAHDCLLWSHDESQDKGKLYNWSPYGNGNTADLLPGFNGERVDPVSGMYHLGNGYRAYNPVLMRFNCPDSLSPFGAGGINPYAYCAGDPVNLTDPSGHISWMGWVGIAMGTLGLALSVVTAGMSIAAAGGLMAAIDAASTTAVAIGGLGVVSDTAAIASGVVEDRNPRASAALGWVSLATGVAGFAAGVRQVTKLRSALKSPVVQDAKYIAMGHDISNVAPVSSADQGIYFFDDVYKTQKRLNIVGHGQVDAKGVGYMTHYVGNNMVPVRGGGVRRLFIRAHSEEALGSYKYIRLVSCHSADGATPMGRQVMEAFGLETKAFHGVVEGLPAPMKVLKDAVEHSPGGILPDLLNMEGQRMTFIGKGANYRPQKFIPD
ncbi:Cell wall-associated polypeptide CWBP200 [Serratia grimesii]|uniref:RHS repeat domain-containing protein n=1 Tax=Serratia grimesii TaxID=82995 RepID=UPI001F4BDD80|nr:RHS repeat-associated core domain-containing protein [Serratia grimesii]ULG12709.1 Rhs-family protein [Serratia grimesii]CAI2793967.1 Cell wall-associated polypeptide CWBP200 [Serratia grimesii]